MANQQTVEEFFVQLGLNVSELESGFVEANRTISQNIGRLNREANLIQIRSQVELAGLDEAEDAERISSLKDNLHVPISEQVMTSPMFQGAAIGDKTIIEGDTITQISLPDLKAEMQKALEQTQMTVALPQQLETSLKAPSTPTQTYETQITVSPNISVDLGGAYVFDDALKAKLTDDITTEIVDNITNAVRQATSNKSYSYSS